MNKTDSQIARCRAWIHDNKVKIELAYKEKERTNNITHKIIKELEIEERKEQIREASKELEILEDIRIIEIS